MSFCWQSRGTFDRGLSIWHWRRTPRLWTRSKKHWTSIQGIGWVVFERLSCDWKDIFTGICSSLVVANVPIYSYLFWLCDQVSLLWILPHNCISSTAEVVVACWTAVCFFVCQDATDGMARCYQSQSAPMTEKERQEAAQRAMSDPEVQVWHFFVVVCKVQSFLAKMMPSSFVKFWTEPCKHVHSFCTNESGWLLPWVGFAVLEDKGKVGMTSKLVCLLTVLPFYWRYKLVAVLTCTYLHCQYVVVSVCC